MLNLLANCIRTSIILGLGVQANDQLISNFPDQTYGNWIKTGTAFNPGPAQGDLLRILEIQNSTGGPVISSEVEGDRPVGTLTSQPFRITKKYISFRIGGGDYESDTCINLLVEGKVVKSTTGLRSDRLSPASWDVSKYENVFAKIEIVDRATGDWGHINIDRIVQTDTPEQKPNMKGPLYQESQRPQFHFTARQWTVNRLNPGQRQEGWVNDLIGLIYYEGEYHLFAQRWNKCWIHAVSKDLVHWKELEPAFWEEKLDSGVQSGTCVIDYENTSGLAKSKSNPAMIAFWSGNDNRSQCIHYSLDKGRTWKPYEKNPILSFPERDPKVFWYAPGKHWVMMLYGDGKYHILTSSNLLDWKDEKNPIPDCFECPDFFQLPLDGDSTKLRWVLIQGNGNYSLGEFDGKKFTEQTKRLPCDAGPNFYATQSWENTSTGDGRRIQTAWMRGSDFPDMPFSQQISFPCELTLHNTSQGPRIFRNPVKEIEKLHASERSWKDLSLESGKTVELETEGDLFRIKAEVVIPTGSSLNFVLRGVPITLMSNALESGTKPAPTASEVKSVEILLDRGSIETYLNRGELSSTRFALPSGKGISVVAKGSGVLIKSVKVYRLKSIWK